MTDEEYSDFRAAIALEFFFMNADPGKGREAMKAALQAVDTFDRLHGVQNMTSSGIVELKKKTLLDLANETPIMTPDDEKAFPGAYYARWIREKALEL